MLSEILEIIIAKEYGPLNFLKRLLCEHEQRCHRTCCCAYNIRL